MSMTVKFRIAAHAAFALLLAAVGLVVFSRSVFPLVLGMTNPVAPLLGMALGLLFIGVPGVAGLGLGIAMDLARGTKTLREVEQTRLLDLVAGTQYMTLALLLVAWHYFAP